MRTLFLSLAMALVAFVGMAQMNVNPPLITVNGEGKISVVPDHVTISVAVESETNDAPSAKAENDAVIRKILQFAKEIGLDAKEVQTDYIRLEPYYKYEERVTRYKAYQSVNITLRDLSKYDKLMMGLINSGANRINSVEFKSKDIVALKDKARLLAVKDAQNKAKAMTAEIGQSIGKAFYIDEIGQFQPVFEAYAKSAAMMDGGGGNSNEPTIALGQITITSQVSVRFLLD